MRHAAPSDKLPEHTQFTLLLLLIGLAGYIDAIGFVVLGGLFVSFMSGNTTQTAVALAKGDWLGALRVVAVIATFFGGICVGAIVREVTPRYSFAVILITETLLLLATAIFLRHGIDMPHLLPLAFAIGMQNNLRRTLNGALLGATFVTGTLVATGQGVARHLLGRADARAWRPHAASWMALSLGALMGALAFVYAGVDIALFAAAALTGLMAVLHMALALRQSAFD